MSLTAVPPAAIVPAAGGVSKHNLTNAGAERLVFKIKCSNNSEYKIKPVFGFVDPNGTVAIEVTRTAGRPKEDKIVVHLATVAADASDPKTAFESATPAGSITIPIAAA